MVKISQFGQKAPLKRIKEIILGQASPKKKDYYAQLSRAGFEKNR